MGRAKRLDDRETLARRAAAGDLKAAKRLVEILEHDGGPDLVDLKRRSDKLKAAAAAFDTLSGLCRSLSDDSWIGAVDETAIQLIYDVAKEAGWDWEADQKFVSWANKATSEEAWGYAARRCRDKADSMLEIPLGNDAWISVPGVDAKVLVDMLVVNFGFDESQFDLTTAGPVLAYADRLHTERRAAIRHWAGNRKWSVDSGGVGVQFAIREGRDLLSQVVDDLAALGVHPDI